MQDVPFQAIQDKARSVTEALCKRWLPHGHRSGNWWVSNCPWRQDDTASLGVSLTTGRFKDFGAAIPGKEGGDMIKLFLLLYPNDCRDMVDAADAVARIVNHPFRKSRRD